MHNYKHLENLSSSIRTLIEHREQKQSTVMSGYSKNFTILAEL